MVSSLRVAAVLLSLSILVFLAPSSIRALPTQAETLKSDPLSSILPGHITNYTVFEGSPSLLLAAARDNSSVSLPFFGNQISLRLTEEQIVTSDFTLLVVDQFGHVEESKPLITVFEGSVESDSHSRIALICVDDSMHGYVCYKQRMYQIESLNLYTTEAQYYDKHVIYPSSTDVTQAFHSLWRDAFGTVDTQAMGEALGATGPIYQCRVVEACDQEYCDLYQQSWIYNLIDVIYFAAEPYIVQINTVIATSAIVRFDYSFQVTNADDLWDAFKEAMEGLDAAGHYLPRDAAHLFTGVSLDGDFLGKSRQNALNTQDAYSLTQHQPKDTYLGWQYLPHQEVMFAHELGHNFGGSHLLFEYRPDGYTIMNYPWSADVCLWFSSQNSAFMSELAGERLAGWSPATVASGHFCDFAVTYFFEAGDPVESGGGRAFFVNTIGSPDYGYHFFGYTSTQVCCIDPEGELHYSGWFKQMDTFPQSLWPNRRQLLVYVITANPPFQILASHEVLSSQDGTEWHYREGSIVGLPPCTEVRFAVGRPDSWSYDWCLCAGWAAVSVYGGDYLGGTVPAGHHYCFFGVPTQWGYAYHVDTIGRPDSGYVFYGCAIEWLSVPEGGQITVSGKFRHGDELGTLAPGRRQTFAYLVKSGEGTIRQSRLLLDYYQFPDWYTVTVSFTELDVGVYQILIGRTDSWLREWYLFAEWVGVTISVS
jgi:hypothetical protein